MPTAAVMTHGGFFCAEKGVMLVQGILTWFADCVPTGTEVEAGSMTAVVGGVIAFLCGWDKAMEALLVLMGMDYVTGMLAAKVKKVGTMARRDMERFFEKKIFLELYVKVEPDWRNRDNLLRRFGYKLD